MLKSVRIGAAVIALAIGGGVAQAARAEEPRAAAGAPSATLVGAGLRVTDLDRSTRFYTDVFGMTVVRKLPHGTLTEVIMGFGDAAAGPAIILMKDSAPGASPAIDMGNGFAKLVVQVSNIDALVTRAKRAGVAATEPSGAMGFKVAFVTDPDGYRLEVIQPPAPPRS